MPAVGLGGRRPLQDRAKVGGGWGRVLAGRWVGVVVWFSARGPSTGSGRTEGSVWWLVVLPKALRQAQDERRGRGLWFRLVFVAHGVPSYVGPCREFAKG